MQFCIMPTISKALSSIFNIRKMLKMKDLGKTLKNLIADKVWHHSRVNLSVLQMRGGAYSCNLKNRVSETPTGVKQVLVTNVKSSGLFCFDVCECSGCMHMHHVHAWFPQRFKKKKTSDLLELELLMVASHQIAAGIRTWILCKGSQWFVSLNHFSSHSSFAAANLMLPAVNSQEITMPSVVSCS